MPPGWACRAFSARHHGKFGLRHVPSGKVNRWNWVLRRCGPRGAGRHHRACEHDQRGRPNRAWCLQVQVSNRGIRLNFRPRPLKSACDGCAKVTLSTPTHTLFWPKRGAIWATFTDRPTSGHVKYPWPGSGPLGYASGSPTQANML